MSETTADEMITPYKRGLLLAVKAGDDQGLLDWESGRLEAERIEDHKAKVHAAAERLSL